MLTLLMREEGRQPAEVKISRSREINTIQGHQFSRGLYFPFMCFFLNERKKQSACRG